MILYHASPSANDKSIEARGLLTSFSATARPEIWLHDIAQRPWAVQHVAKRHGCKGRDVTVYKVQISGAKVRKRGRGVYTCSVDIPAVALERSQFRFVTIAGQ